MKKLLILLFSIFISFNSYGEWTKQYTWDNGDALFLDFSTIKEHDGYMFWWELKNTPNSEFIKSGMVYSKGDCSRMRSKVLTVIFFTELMGKGESQSRDYDEWSYPSPDTQVYQMLNFICDLEL